MSVRPKTNQRQALLSRQQKYSSVPGQFEQMLNDIQTPAQANMPSDLMVADLFGNETDAVGGAEDGLQKLKSVQRDLNVAEEAVYQ